MALCIHSLFFNSIFCLISSLSICYTLFRKYFNITEINLKPNLIIFLTVLITGQHLYRDIYLGNVNTLLLFLVLISIHYHLKKSDLKASMGFSLSMIIKPHFLIFLGLFILLKRYRIFYYTLLFIMISTIVPTLFWGWQKTWSLN